MLEFTRPSPAFHIAVHPDRHEVVVAPAGELDLTTVALLDGALAEQRAAGSTDVVLDLRAVTFMDSSGLQLILSRVTEAEDDGCRLRLVPGPPAVRLLFEVTGTAERLPFMDRQLS